VRRYRQADLSSRGGPVTWRRASASRGSSPIATVLRHGRAIPGVPEDGESKTTVAAIIPTGRRGVRVSRLCPLSADTNTSSGDGSSAVNGMLTADQVADDVVAALRNDRFLIPPHPEVAGYFALKAQCHERWLGGMQQLSARHAARSES
jgi:hypothetical protein